MNLSNTEVQEIICGTEYGTGIERQEFGTPQPSKKDIGLEERMNRKIEEGLKSIEGRLKEEGEERKRIRRECKEAREREEETRKMEKKEWKVRLERERKERKEEIEEILGKIGSLEKGRVERRKMGQEDGRRLDKEKTRSRGYVEENVVTEREDPKNRGGM
ncbi:hypothetical protein TSAR_000492 [Trichomalopsis sarcophagae]|uniref:Uncharacterized protein n=1 Tax=Trichomalopsis sarcophagae TaxID=543379 RepID=A0A232EPV9_9HYME|nr:hypothetical protein TSAR_000492 [Trichomalopsis sarcophagae]